MVEIIKAATEEELDLCDSFLTKLIQEERRFDSNVKETYVVSHYFSKFLEKKQFADIYAFYLAKKDGVPVGFLYGYWKWEEGEMYHASTGHIDALYVSKMFRHQGIAHLLLQEFYQWCQERDIKIVEIGVFEKNTEALMLYQNQGFQPNCLYLKKYLEGEVR